MRERNILDVHKERQPVPRHVPPLFAIHEGIDRRARRVDLFATRDVLQRRAVDHRRIQGRDDHLLVRGGKVVGGAFGERLARRVDDRTGYARFEAIFERERVPVGGGVGVVTPLWIRVPSERQFLCGPRRVEQLGGKALTGPPALKLVTAAKDEVMTTRRIPASCRSGPS